VIENNIGKLPDPPVGWCSWYHFYQGISQVVIEENLEKIIEFKDQLPFNLVQIDDGFQKQVGDWLEFNDRFPNGVSPLAGEKNMPAAHLGCGSHRSSFTRGRNLCANIRTGCCDIKMGLLSVLDLYGIRWVRRWI
jgi:hypothetical protein